MMQSRTTPEVSSRPGRASLLDTMRLLGKVAIPTLSAGVIVRRPTVMKLAETLQFDRAAVRVLQRLRARYGPGPLRLRIPGRSVAVLLCAGDVHRVLVDSAKDFAPATPEKAAALGHFQPHGVLVSRGSRRAERREVNELALDTDRRLHRLAGAVTAKTRDEAQAIADAAGIAGHLEWSRFNAGWWRLVRRIVLGDVARDEDSLTDQLAALRSAANWAFLRPRSTSALERFQQRLRAYLDRAEPGSLAAALRATSAAPGADPDGQVPHWLFAFDAAGMVTFRTLALLATHPEQADNVDRELAGRDLDEAQDLPYLRACVLDSVRLWPTTPLLLRESSTETTWHGDTLPAGTSVLVCTPFFHRDGETVDYSDSFAPQLWLDGKAHDHPGLVPFSAGPGECPGQNLVLLVTSTLLATFLRTYRWRYTAPVRLDPSHPLPSTLNSFGLRFAVERSEP